MTTRNPVIVQARQLLAAVPPVVAASLPLRWTIRIDAFDCWRREMEDAGELLTTVSDHPPTLLGIPYDLGWPRMPDMIQLRIVVEELVRPATNG